jgi:AcrR family transcriptional regulator
MALLRLKKKKRKPGERAGLTRTKIALAAAEQIEKGGSAAFSLRNLARSLGVAPTTVSAHFKGGLDDLEDEILRTLLADVAPPVELKQEPIEYIEGVFYSTVKALQGRPTIAMLTILRLTRNPFVAPKVAERTLASLTALGVAPQNMAAAYRATLQVLFAMILAGPARSYHPSASENGKPDLPPLTISGSEYAYVSKFRQAVLDDLAEAAYWTPDVQTVKSGVHRLVQELGVG